MEESEEGTMEDIEEKEETCKDGQERVYLPSSSSSTRPEELECDISAYVMYHQAKTILPSLSFDFLPDNLGDNRTEFPHTMYASCGTQATSCHLNCILLMKITNLTESKPKKEKDSDSEDESDESDDEEAEANLAQLSTLKVDHQGCVNRLRVNATGRRVLVASWSEMGSVHVWDLTQHYQALDDGANLKQFERQRQNTKPIFSFSGHLIEGYGLDWSPVSQGFLATGDCKKNIHIWKPNDSTFLVDQRPLVGHSDSVEDIQWSPNETSVLASCSVDRSIRIWDIRAAPNKACMLTVESAHDQDVNVLSWNGMEPFLVSGGDDGAIKIWDLREIQKNQALATFKHHTGAITSVEWHPTDRTVFAASGADDQLTLWDLALERDAEAVDEESDATKNLPPQLLFIHQGQSDIKELHWHRQISGAIVSTAHDGFNIFKTISV